MAVQLPLFTRAQECAGYLSPDRRGFFSVLMDIWGRKRQQSYPLCQLMPFIEGLDPRFDTWITQAEFFAACRRLIALARIDLQFIDLDTYRIPALAGRSPDSLVDATLRYCADEGLLTPSLLVFSGRGLQAKWFLERPVPRQALPRWNAVQRALVDRLAPLGADPQARDASRVLRMVNTVNTKSGEVCRVAFFEPGSDGLPIRYNFEVMAMEMLPLGRQELEQRKRDYAQRGKFRAFAGSQRGHLRSLGNRQLAWDRLEDLRALREMRGGGAREGERMKHLFWHLNFLMLSGVRNSGSMHHEAVGLAKELDPRWSAASPELMTLYAKAKQFEAGERVEFEGRKYPSLYTPKNDTLINLFEVTDDEQRRLRTLISTGMAAERHRKRDEARRRAAGELEREEYLASIRAEVPALERDRLRKEAERRVAGSVSREALLAEAEQRRIEAEKLRQQGMSVRKIAESLNCSKSAVGRYLRLD